MKLRSLTLYHLDIPCKNEFTHSRVTRNSSEVILAKLITDSGQIGWGEMLPRSFVTGETIDSIMSDDHSDVLISLLDKELNSAGFTQWIHDHLNNGHTSLSFIGGVEMGVIDLLSQTGQLDLDSMIGAKRGDGVGRCVTVGLDCEPNEIRARFISSRLKKATAIKLKVGQSLDRDVECILQLSSLCKGSVELRLDGNGIQTFNSTSDLLNSIDVHHIHSFEEPLVLDDAARQDGLRELHQRYNVDFMADEAVCSMKDAENIASDGSYQLFNIRVGKHGGVCASAAIRDFAKSKGIGVVGGSMVGETSVLTQASTVFLSRSPTLNYVEGLGQNRSWLLHDPLQQTDDVSDHIFNRFTADEAVIEKTLIRQREITL